MASVRKLTLTILGNAKGAMDALRGTETQAVKFQRSIGTLSKSLTVGFAAIGAAGVYMGKQIADGALMAVKAAAEDEKSRKLLENQIRQLTNANDAQIASNEKFISSLSFSAAVADDQLRPALATLVRATGNLGDAQKLLKTSLDISAGSGKELSDVVLAVGKAANGNIGALTRLGIPISENAKKAKDFNAAISEVAATFSGASDAAVATFDGRMRQLRIGIDEAVESIGYALLPFAERFVTFINNNIVPALQIFADNVGKEGIGKSVSLAIASMGELGDRGIDAMEKLTLGVLTSAKAVVDLIEKLALAATILGMVTYNASLTFKAIAAGFSSDVAQDKLNDAIKATPALFDKLRGSVAASSAALEESKRTLGDRTRAQNGANSATGKGAGLQEQYGGAVSGATRAVNTAKDALTKYTRQLDASNSAKAAARRASQDLERADRSVAESLRDLETAQRRFNQITRGYGEGSAEATDRQIALAQAQRDLERSGYDVERATFAITDAENELRDLRRDPRATPEQIREAEIALAEARLSLADSTDAQRDATVSVTEAQRQLDIAVNGAREGTNEYADALSELEAAQRSYQSAIESQIEAREREAEAIKKVKEAEEELAKVRAQLPKGTLTDPATGAIIETDTKTTGHPSFMAAVRALHPNSPALKSPTPVAAARKQFPKLYEDYKKAGLALASGGIVTRPTQALIGEAGAEAVIPLDRLPLGGNTNVYVTVNAGLGVDGAEVGDEIVNVLQRYNRRNGALPLKVSG
jgi:hypothetical protein